VCMRMQKHLLKIIITFIINFLFILFLDLIASTKSVNIAKIVSGKKINNIHFTFQVPKISLRNFFDQKREAHKQFKALLSLSLSPRLSFHTVSVDI